MKLRVLKKKLKQNCNYYEHANMKCCDTVRLYKVNSAEDIELVEEKS